MNEKEIIMEHAEDKLNNVTRYCLHIIDFDMDKESYDIYDLEYCMNRFDYIEEDLIITKQLLRGILL
jgi:hypothetical protein